MKQHILSLTGPPDLLAVLPFHLGFHPARSVVVVCLHDKQLGLVARLDTEADPHRASSAAASILQVVRREAPTGVMVIGYEDEVGQSEPLSRAIAAGLGVERITLIDRVVVRGDRWTGLMCTCCPDEQVPAAHEVGAVATYVGLGRTALGSREELATIVQPSGPASPTLSQAIDDWVADVLHGDQLLAPLASAAGGLRRAVTWADRCLAAWADLFAGHFDGRDVPEDQLRLLLGSLRHRGLRDGIIAMTCPGSLGLDVLDARLVELLDEYVAPVVEDVGDDADGEEDLRMRLRTRLQRLCRLAPDDHAAPVLTVTAAQAWYSGDGASARVALDRALEVEPGHVLARLLDHLLQRGIRPPGLEAA